MAPKKTTSKPEASSSMKSLADLKELDLNNLVRELEAARRELYIFVMKKNLGELKQVHLLKKQRRYIAQISTFLTRSI